MSAFTLLQGDCRNVLATLPDESVQCCITSPPYWGLRDYRTASWEGGDQNCDHVSDESKTKKFGNDAFNENRPSREETKTAGYYFDKECEKCGATRIDAQFGLEQSPKEYVDNLVKVFREVRRVLRDDGTLWLNLGDSYNGSGKGANGDGSAGKAGDINSGSKGTQQGTFTKSDVIGLKPKDLVGIPWRVAFALQADGWYLRQDIIWHKPNPMPESVTDRCTKSHEYIFLMAKSVKYYFDNDAIKENSTSFVAGTETSIRFGGNKYGDLEEQLHRTKSGNEYTDSGKRNKRSVWTVSTRPFKEAHFATFPPELIEPCVLASTSHFGMCAECKTPYKRIVERGEIPDRTTRDNTLGVIPGRDKTTRLNSVDMAVIPTTTTGWGKTCDCASDEVEQCVVLDPFNGAGTTGVVSIQNNRQYVGIELNPEYLEMARKRIQKTWEGITLPLFL